MFHQHLRSYQSGWIPICDSAHSWWNYSAALWGDQAISIMTRYPTQTHYPDTVVINPYPILIMPNASLVNDQYQFCKALVWLGLDLNTEQCASEACALLIRPSHPVTLFRHFMSASTSSRICIRHQTTLNMTLKLNFMILEAIYTIDATWKCEILFLLYKHRLIQGTRVHFWMRSEAYFPTLVVPPGGSPWWRRWRLSTNRAIGILYCRDSSPQPPLISLNHVITHRSAVYLFILLHFFKGSWTS